MKPDPQPFYVGGEWRGRDARDPQSIVNPFDGSLVGRCALAGRDDIEDAVLRAQQGFIRSRDLQSYERSEILQSIAHRIRERKEEIARLITAEAGKPIRFSEIEVDRAVLTFSLAGEEAKRIEGEVVPLDLAPHSRDRVGIVRRFPIGIILAITPFNFPLNLVAHKVAPAMAAGNAVLLKPAPQAPLTSLLLAAIVGESGYPKEAFSVLPCGNDIAGALVEDERIAMLSFTGSPAVGWMLKSKSGRKKVVLELGGNAGVIVDRSADVGAVVDRIAAGAFMYAGQVCIKVQRIFVHQDLYDEFRDRLCAAARSIHVGNPSDPDTVVGPLIDDAAGARVEAWIQEAVTAGAHVLEGGRRSGRMITPTVLEDVDRKSKVYCSEIFGPVVTLHRFSTIEEAVNGVNDSPFGLQAGVYSTDMRSILFAYRALDVGAVVVNDTPAFRVDNMPYGGVKASGFGREGVRYAIETMTEPKLLVVQG
ncbi:MAG: aldehyde dehydrogenase family protein [Bacteroidota bacterium]